MKTGTFDKFYSAVPPVPRIGEYWYIFRSGDNGGVGSAMCSNAHFELRMNNPLPGQGCGLGRPSMWAKGYDIF